MHVFSEGKPSDFAGLGAGGPRWVLHLDGPITETFHHLVRADALITSQSKLSWAAALLSTGRAFAPFARVAAERFPLGPGRRLEPCLEGPVEAR